MEIAMRLGIAALVLAASAWCQVATASVPTGGWVFDSSPDFPGFTRLVVQKSHGKLSGTVTSHWYGDLAMVDPHEDHGRLVFQLSNGNPRVPMADIVVA